MAPRACWGVHVLFSLKNAIVCNVSFRRDFCSPSKKAEARTESFGQVKSSFCHILLKLFVQVKERRIEFFVFKSCGTDISKVAKCFTSIKFKYFSKDLNVVAHALDQFCFKFDIDSEYFHSFSYRLVR